AQSLHRPAVARVGAPEAGRVGGAPVDALAEVPEVEAALARAGEDGGRRGQGGAAAAPVAAYWVRMSSMAFADQGISSPSTASHPVSSSSQSPAAPIAARSGVPLPRVRTSLTGSTSRSRAAVHSRSPASG